jgi:hypothetical protein
MTRAGALLLKSPPGERPRSARRWRWIQSIASPALRTRDRRAHRARRPSSRASRCRSFSRTSAPESVVEKFLSLVLHRQFHRLSEVLDDEFVRIEPDSLPYGGRYKGPRGYAASFSSLNSVGRRAPDRYQGEDRPQRGLSPGHGGLAGPVGSSTRRLLPAYPLCKRMLRDPRMRSVRPSLCECARIDDGVLDQLRRLGKGGCAT